MTPLILLVEDDDDEAELTRRAFSTAGVEAPIIRVADGIEALDFLFARGRYENRRNEALPALVLLDVSLPRVSGLEALAVIRGDERTRSVPVIVLTSSAEDVLRLEAYKQYCNTHVQKPIKFEDLIASARRLGVLFLI